MAPAEIIDLTTPPTSPHPIQVDSDREPGQIDGEPTPNGEAGPSKKRTPIAPRVRGGDWKRKGRKVAVSEDVEEGEMLETPPASASAGEVEYAKSGRDDNRRGGDSDEVNGLRMESEDARRSRQMQRPKRRSSRSRSRERSPDEFVDRLNGSVAKAEHDSKPAKRKKKRRRRSRSRSPGHSQSDPFYVDIQPAAPTHVTQPAPEVAFLPEATDSAKEEFKLLLPAHVSVFDGKPIEIQEPSEPESEEDDFIEFLDMDDRNVGVIRYFDATSDDSPKKPARSICKHCGGEGHTMRECRVQICLTCGARDEHSTRSCPVNRQCFTCGMKGHLNRDCPNRYTVGMSRYDPNGCERCDATTHKANECPTLWRIYEYVDEEERDNVMKRRTELGALPFEGDGVGFVATDEWCYNCGESGHLGDDCVAVMHVSYKPDEPSAFSALNVSRGPFDATSVGPSTSRKPPVWDLPVPMDVGKKGKQKERARMEQFHAQTREEEDTDDFFGDLGRSMNKGQNSKSRTDRRKDKKSGENGRKKRAREHQDDPDDWYEKSRKSQRAPPPHNRSSDRRSDRMPAGDKMTMAPLNDDRHFDTSRRDPTPKLLGRLSDDRKGTENRRSDNRDRDRDRDRDRHGSRRKASRSDYSDYGYGGGHPFATPSHELEDRYGGRDRDRSSSSYQREDWNRLREQRDRDRGGWEQGPRYKGGYA